MLVLLVRKVLVGLLILVFWCVTIHVVTISLSFIALSRSDDRIFVLKGCHLVILKYVVFVLMYLRCVR